MKHTTHNLKHTTHNLKLETKVSSFKIQDLSSKFQDSRFKFQDLSFTFYERGFSLFEVLITISIFAVVGVSISQLIGVGLQANRTSGQKTVAIELAQETLRAVNAIFTEQWNNIYTLAKGSGNAYYPANTIALCGTIKWCVRSGTESASANNLTYIRSFYVENVSRTGGNIDTAYSAPNDDPSTQKVTITISWRDAGANQLGAITISDYFTRARNAAASQTQWVLGGIAPTAGENGNFNTGIFSASSPGIDLSVSTSIKLSQ